MGPRQLQSQIHSDYSSVSDTWIAYRTGVSGLYAAASKKDDYSDHLIREFNRKIQNLNQPTGLFIAPFDAGYRFIGTQIFPPVGIDTISGFAFPNETLSSPSGVSYSWTVDSVSRGTGSTFIPTVYDIGKTITCVVDNVSYSATVWHPNQISAVKAFWWAGATSGVYKSGTSNAAVDGEIVGLFSGLINSETATAIGTASLYKTGLLSSPCIQMPDSAFFDIGPPPEDIALNQKYFNVFMGARATGAVGGSHYLFSTSDTSENILSFGPLLSGTGNYFITASTATGADYTYVGRASNTGYSVYNAAAAYNDGSVRLRVNGSGAATGSLGGTGISSSTNSVMYLNRSIGTPTFAVSNPCDLTAVILTAGNAQISSQDSNRIERFIGLLGGVNIPLSTGRKSVNLRFYMGSAGSVSVTVGGITKNMSGNEGTMTFTAAEIASLNLSANLNVSGSATADPNIDTIDILAEDAFKVNNLSYTAGSSTNFNFTIVYDELADNDTLDFQVSLNT